MTERVNLVDAYDNRSVVAKLVNMEERISGAETSVEASAEAAASSASAAAVSLAAAKTSEANAKASADTAASILSNTVDLSSKQTITGAKTFAGDTTVTGQLISSGTNTLSGTTELEGTVELDSTAVATLNGKVTASNTGNAIKVANHDTALMSNDVLSAKDINEVNGSANTLVHRIGEKETVAKVLEILGLDGRLYFPHKLFPLSYDTSQNIGKYIEVAKIERIESDGYYIVEVISGSNNAPCYGKLMIQEIGEAVWIDVVHGDINYALTTDAIHLATSSSDNYLHVFVKQVSTWGTLYGRLAVDLRTWADGVVTSSHFYWLEQSEMTIYDSLPSTMTEVTIKQPYQA